MTKSTGNDSLATRPKPGRWLKAILGLVMLIAAATQVEAGLVVHVDSGSALLHAADLQVEPDGSGGPLHPDNDCVTFVCHGSSLMAAPETGMLTQAGTPATFDRDRAVAGNVILPPLHPPKNSFHV